jgi:tyrosine-protein kinase Etk/Wzc
MEAQQLSLDVSKTVNQEEINLLDLIIALVKRKRLIAAITSGMTVLALMACVVVTPVYQGTAEILPRQESSATSGLLNMLGAAAGALTGLSGVSPTTSSDVYVGLLQSSAVLDRIIDRFNLMQVYKLNRFLGKWRSYTREDAREDLTDNALIESDSASGLITIGIQDSDPAKAAEMANSFIEELTRLNQHLQVVEANQRRQFFEGELEKTAEALARAEEAVRMFQEATGALQIDEQARAVMTGIATLEAQVAAKEIQLKVMKTYATQNNPDIKRLQEELNALRQERKKLEEKEQNYYSHADTLIPTGKIPSLGTEYLRKQREFKYQQTLWEVLIKQYEVARLDEAKNSSAVQVVAEATVPEKKYKPKMVLMVIVGAVVGFILAVAAAITIEAIRKASRNPTNVERLEDFRRYFRRRI